MSDELIYLPERAQEMLIDWCEILVDNNYDLGEPLNIWESAAFLVANGYADEFELTVEQTAVILTFANDHWDRIKVLLSEDE